MKNRMNLLLILLINVTMLGCNQEIRDTLELPLEPDLSSGGWSAVDSTAPPAPITDITITGLNSGQVVLGWDSGEGQSDSVMDFAGFNIYRRIGASSWTQINLTGLIGEDNLVQTANNAFDYIYTDENVTTGITYDYIIEAVDLGGQFSTNVISGITPALPGTVNSISGTVTKNGYPVAGAYVVAVDTKKVLIVGDSSGSVYTDTLGNFNLSELDGNNQVFTVFVFFNGVSDSQNKITLDGADATGIALDLTPRR